MAQWDGGMRLKEWQNKNEIEEEETNSIDISQDADETQQQQLPGRETRHHTLVFNLTSVLTGEKVSRAELRLYTLVARDRSTYVGEDRLVTVHEGLRPRHQPPIAERHVYGRSSGWEAFDVTDVVQKWVRGGVTSSDDGVRVLEVSITSVFNSTSSAALDVDIDVDPEHNEGPLLVVFSRDIRYHNRKDLQNMIDHESDVRGSDKVTATGDNGEISKQFGGVSQGRTRRAARMPQREDELPVVVTNRTEASPVRVRRDNGNTKRKRNSCRRQPMYVDFQEINWHQWIIAPPGYQAFECVGKCYVPIGAHLSPTKHAIIQTLVHAAHPKQAARACCVPTKLEPISILYLDANNIITYKYHYDGMVVAECGCR
nr:hypothetical protein BaRGS_000384 [Batillaria attramentaria]